MATTGDKERKSSPDRDTARRSGEPDRSRERESTRDRDRTRDRTRDRDRTPGGDRVPVGQAMRLAAAQLAELLQCEPGSVSSVKPTSEGWTASVEVVEVERIPETTSVMGSYRVQLDNRGNLLGYERTERYARGQVGERK